MAPTSGDRVWQRLPQGWIEFRAFGDRTPDEWLEWYLASGEGWLPDEARTAIVEGFRAGVAAFAGTDFDFAGVSLTAGDRPAASFLCTNVVRATAGIEVPTTPFHRLFPLVRFGDEAGAETFTAPDGRVGTVASGRLAHGRHPERGDRRRAASAGRRRNRPRDGHVLGPDAARRAGTADRLRPVDDAGPARGGRAGAAGGRFRLGAAHRVT